MKSDWEFGIDQFLDEFEESIVDTHKKIAFDLLAAVVLGSPVDTGRFRNAWTLALNGPDEYTPPENYSDTLSPEEAAERSVAKADGDLGSYQTLSGGDPPVIWINNQLPYAQRLEDGHSRTKAPNGVLRIHIETLQMKVEDGVL